MQNAARGFVKIHHLRLADIEDMDQEVRHHSLLQRGIESFNESVRQLANKTHGVCEKQWLVVWQGDLARGGIECCEELVLNQHLGAGESTEKRGLASIRVADDGGIGDRSTLTVLALSGSAALHRFQFTL